MKCLKGEKAYTLVGVLLIFTIISILGISLVSLSFSSIKSSQKQRENQAVFYVAEAGLNYLTNKFEIGVNDIYEEEHVTTIEEFFSEISKLEFVPDRYEEFERVEDFEPYSELKVSSVGGSSDEYKLTSVGYLEGEKRAVSQTIKIEWQDKYEEIEEKPITPIINTPPFAVFTTGKFTMLNGTIIGDIGTVSTQNGMINFPAGGGPTLNGKIYVPDGNEGIVNQAHYLNFPIDELDSSYEIPALPPYPDYPTNIKKYPGNDLILDWNDKSKYTLNLTENIEINRLYIPSGLHDFTINLNGEDRIIVVNQLDSMGSIKVTGNGKLTLMVKSEMNFGAGNINSEKNIKNLDIFYAGLEKPNFGGDMKIFGNLYAKTSKLEIGASSGIQGNVLSGGASIIITGGSENIAQMVFAPNAHVQFTGGGKLKGKVIADRFTITGGGRVDFTSPNIDDDMFNPNLDGGSSESEGGTELVETGAKPSITKTSVREITN